MDGVAEVFDGVETGDRDKDHLRVALRPQPEGLRTAESRLWDDCQRQ